MAFRKWVGELRKALNLPARNGRHLSIIASSLWKYTGEDVQAVFREVAKFSEERHQELHQDYKYRPGSRGDARQAKKEEKRSSKRIKGRRGESRQPEPPSQFQILFGEYITAT
ncbi:hypothetical protein CALCODRAFT_485627 [Calocera cornea HHB12733]|uniref:HMG box domain-containing protein n=1 Tax=Calocera cornea HHB12733 TaxID=1353952 RepID=A0A165E8U3_9BASI|nr:hypothetical protein CALCODRAFT_485627 [Calocera cornea HHB12733]